MGYRKYGIDPEWVERVKRKLANPEYRQRVQAVLQGVSRADLQDRRRVKRLMQHLSRTLDEPVSADLGDRLVRFVLDQKIDPNNSWQLLKLWRMFH